MNTDLIILLGGSVAGVLLVLVNFFTIRALLKTRNSRGYSKVAFWLIFISLSYFSFYAFWFGDMILFISYLVQSLSILIVLYLVYKFDVPPPSFTFSDLESVGNLTVRDTVIEIGV